MLILITCTKVKYKLLMTSIPVLTTYIIFGKTDVQCFMTLRYIKWVNAIYQANKSNDKQMEKYQTKNLLHHKTKKNQSNATIKTNVKYFPTTHLRKYWLISKIYRYNLTRKINHISCSSSLCYFWTHTHLSLTFLD